MPLNEYKYLKKTDKGQHIDLATGKSIDDKAFDAMTDVSDKTSVDVLAKGKASNTKGIHTALLAAGMIPAYGNIADVADAVLYALEGEFGESAWSMAAAIPVIGQIVRIKKIQKGVSSLPSSVQKKLIEGDYIPTWISSSKIRRTHGAPTSMSEKILTEGMSDQRLAKNIINDRTERYRTMLEQIEKGEKILKDFGIDL